jgi:hypothetical protein
MARTIKSTPLQTASDVQPPTAISGKPAWQAPPTPRGDGGLSTGSTGGNFADDSLNRPNSTPAELLEPGTGNP